ncbi:ATP-binding cassette subfamily C protein CydD [Georgenia soli]|uniref:ATP-binding cassette subfamily C protein CydD n=1 Tax=Georgenia soli TaxID=638953 RepID=A0A2A9EPN1_9MICO|nr:thiol reductant ABC exporter subunit CydD [Georgenia soli]PFG40858.1 ATP-binding cassette subfamily C protein CydD [Georgenia soli]
MKPLDPRLLRHARAARRYIAVTALTGFVTAALVIAQALLISRAAAPVIEGRAGWAHAAPLVAVLTGVFAARFLVLLVQESVAHRAARDVVADLREQVLARAVALGPRWLGGHGVQVTTLATRGLDDLEPYFVRYLPQLLLAATVTPATLAVILGLDLTSALIITVTIPLIPVFMWLIGVLTQRFAADKLAAMERLGGQLLDLLAGLSTLKALGREHGPGRRVGQLGEAYTRTTMATLKVAFLSGAVLEFLASISVALVAVTIGMRLVYGDVGLTTALAVLMLAPEVYRPLREVGTQFHAASDGVAAAEQAFGILEQAPPTAGTVPAPDLRRTDVVLDGVTVAAPGRGLDAPWRLSARLRPGRVVALVGPSGAGKSTAAAIVLGLLRPDDGAVRLVPAAPATDAGPVPGTVSAPGAGSIPGGAAPSTASGPGAGGVDLADVDPSSWHEQVTWVPQRPVILPGTVRSNVLGSDAAAVDDRVRAAAAATGLDAVLGELPAGWDTQLGHGGVGLSVGQRQRLALTAALLGDQQLVVLDEPSAHLDAASEQHVLDAVAALRAAGRTVLVIAHRASLVAAADHVVTVTSRSVPAGAGGTPAADRGDDVSAVRTLGPGAGRPSPAAGNTSGAAR